jgi:1-acyl-sn-glycerol-3-phosphate acyltransferase
MKRFLIFFILLVVKILSRLFYRFEYRFIGDQVPKWDDINLVVFLNHTSLYEPLFLGLAPLKFLWKGSSRFLVPGADKTLKRPLVGWFFKNFAPKMISISRKRDHTWDYFLSQLEKDSLVLIAPEGRMMRETGLDLDGNEMTIRTGIVDILNQMKEGKIIFIYSGGLHHVQIPGQRWPKLFKTLKVNFEITDILTYKSFFLKKSESDFLSKDEVVEDLEKRKKEHCPS